LLTTIRLSAISFAGTARTLVAVGTASEDSMLATTRAAAPRSGTVWAPAGAGGAAAAARLRTGCSVTGTGAGSALAAGRAATPSVPPVSLVPPSLPPLSVPPLSVPPLGAGTAGGAGALPAASAAGAGAGAAGVCGVAAGADGCRSRVVGGPCPSSGRTVTRVACAPAGRGSSAPFPLAAPSGA
jgi:hypothetical protein